jgi:hypothetical protein
MPLELLLIRDTFTLASTTGRLYYNGDLFGYVLEDRDRGLSADDPTTWPRKVKRETCIPIGRYRVVWALSPSRRVYTPRLVDVPAFQGVLIHSGNVAAHTEACLLPGISRGVDRVVKSKIACDWLYPRIRDADECWITIRREGWTD